MLRVCVVGSGPGGLYTAKYLLKSSLGERMKIDVVEKLPMCYGLVRYGVAPDHPEVKSVSNDFDMVMNDERVRFFGNVEVGKHVSVDQLKQNYDAVVLSYGATSEKKLGLEGEFETKNIWGAREFVNWYNGHPEMAGRAPPMLDCESAVVVGNGNVALDCARVLAKPIDELAKTDISSAALEVLSQSKVKRVSVLGRRGAVQSAFTIKELRELTRIDNVGCLVHPEELKASMVPAAVEEMNGTQGKPRIIKLLEKSAEEYEKLKVLERTVDLRFLVSPTQIHRDSADRVSKLTVQKSGLDGPAFRQHATPLDGQFEDIECGILIRSIGFQSEPLPGVPFNELAHTVENEGGRVTGADGLYTAGWVKRGPKGIIGTNIPDARETVDNIVADFTSKSPKPEVNDIASLFSNNCSPIDWPAYMRIHDEEVKRGSASKPPKPRDKIIDVSEMLRIANSS